MEQWKKYLSKVIEWPVVVADYARISDNEQGLTIDLVFESYPIVRFAFEDSVLSYTVCDEGRRLKTLSFITEQYGADACKGCPVFIVEGSSYLRWFNAESFDTLSGFEIMHLVIVTSNDIVDLLSTYPPEIKIVDESA